MSMIHFAIKIECNDTNEAFDMFYDLSNHSFTTSFLNNSISYHAGRTRMFVQSLFRKIIGTPRTLSVMALFPPPASAVHNHEMIFDDFVYKKDDLKITISKKLIEEKSVC